MILGIDVGGTKIAAGLLDETGSIHRLTRRPTPDGDPTAIDRAIAEVWQEYAAVTQVRAVGMAVAGLGIGILRTGRIVVASKTIRALVCDRPA